MLRAAALTLVLGLGALAPGPAAAHAVLLETVPADGAVLDAAPRATSACWFRISRSGTCR